MRYLQRIFVTIFCVLFAGLSYAACVGENLLPTLTEQERTKLDTLVASTPFGTGLHWRATKGDQQIDIIGTLHLDHPKMDDLFNSLQPFVEQADIVLLETTPADEARVLEYLSTTPEAISIMNGPTLADLLDKETWGRLSVTAQERGIPGFMAAKFQPWYLMLMLSMPTCMMRDVQQGKRGLDHRIMAYAEAQNIPMVAVEDAIQALTLMSDNSIKDQLTMLKGAMLGDQDLTNIFETMTTSYFEGKPAETWQVSKIFAEKLLGDISAEEWDLQTQFEEKLLTQRNHNWVPVITTRSEKRIVLAVGAGHLPGEQGILNLLQTQGYTLNAMPLDDMR